MGMHDQQFKLLISEFPMEFIELFLPQVARKIDELKPWPLDKEVVAANRRSRSRAADLVFQAKIQGKDSCIVILIEPQAQFQPHFPMRLLHYFSGLLLKYRVPVYPVALFSYDKPETVEPNFYQVEVLGKQLISFEYETIQLNILDWRDYCRRRNTIAAALMARMRIAKRDRPEVEFECNRMIATSKLSAERKLVLAEFKNSYLILDDEEMKVYESHLRKASKKLREEIMNATSHWERKGRREGQQSMALCLLNKRFGKLNDKQITKIETLNLEQLGRLAGALLDFKSIEDLENWLSNA